MLVPFYTSVLSTQDYGVADLITTTSSLLLYVVTINISDSVLRFAIDRKDKQDEILKYGLDIITIGCLLFAIALFLVYYSGIISWPIWYFVFLYIHLVLSAFHQLLSNYLRAIDKVKMVAISGIILTATTVFCNLFLLLIVNLGLYGYIISILLGLLASTIYSAVNCTGLKHCISTWYKDYKTIKEMCVYSIPLIFNGIAWWMNSSLDKYFVIVICGVAINGIYAVASKIPTILTVFHSIFAQAWNLSAIKEFDKEDSDGFFTNTYKTYNAALVGVCALLILLNIPLAKLLFAKDFFTAWNYSSILLISIVFSSMSSFLGSIFSAVKNSKIFAISTIAAAIVNTLLNALLIPLQGALGAAIATAISFFVIWIVRYVCAKKYINLRTNLLKDLSVYCLLAIQIFLEHTHNHCYIGQIIIVIFIFLIYGNIYSNIIIKLMRRIKK